ncbi:Na+/H+ antiporter NhaC family protein [Agathobacter rectalis]|uniref:Na+/H+ antiporter NhaC family protein n=1 Tax=Agathobacter rectalis TaxID=39491 RepID=UPI0032BF51B7
MILAVKYVPAMYATVWALVPPVVAIVLALITKEVYSSLFVGIVIGGLFYGNVFQSGFSAERSVLHIFEDGLVGVLSDPDNVGILIFLVVLGVMVSMMNKAGGSAAFGEWASEHIKTRIGAQLAAIMLGVLIFIDDYFNCLTVGSVMRPVTDKHQVSRAKLAYLIDATAAPVCIIAPISSWAAAVTGFVKGEDGFSIFIKAIPYNYYALFTIIAMVTLVVLQVDFGPMAKHEANAKKGDLFTTGDRPYAESKQDVIKGKGKVIDLIFPILVLIICCIIGMIYTGGFFDGTGFVDAFAGSNASIGLMLGSFFALIITICFYSIRRVLRFTDCCNSIPEGFKAMVPAILILTFAWTLKTMTESLGAKEFVAGLVGGVSGPLLGLFPAIIFVVGAFLAFATGTSWGTFGILIPIVVNIFSGTNHTMMIISISACMAGAVCGDHCSPISDTTIMASAGAQCNHMNHVSTQLPYAVLVAGISCLTYIIAGFVRNPVVPFIIGVFILIGTFVGIKYITRTDKANEQEE